MATMTMGPRHKRHEQPVVVEAPMEESVLPELVTIEQYAEPLTIEKIVYVDRPVEVISEVIKYQDRIVHVPTEVIKEVTVVEEKLVYVDVIKEVEVVKEVETKVEVFVDKEIKVLPKWALVFMSVETVVVVLLIVSKLF